MDASKANFNDEASLRRWNRALAVFAWLGIGWAIYAVGDVFLSSDFAIGLNTKSGVKLLTASDFSKSQRIVTALILIPSLVCWIYCLWQIVMLAKQFSKGEIFSIGMVKCLERFGYGLVAQGVSEMLLVPMLSTYLVSQGKVESVEDIWEHVLGGGVLTSMMAAILIVVITRILRIGIRLREDSELTI